MSYNQIFGQEQATKILKNAWENKRMAFAYLFLGRPGTGRLFMARALAKATNCQAQTFPPCLTCLSCIKIEKKNHPDVHYIQKEDSQFIKIEQIHQMQRQIILRPYEGKCSVFIIIDAEDLTEEAANSLLKILEEPPRNSLIILIASELFRIFPTIASRCQKIRFFPLAKTKAADILSEDYRLDNYTSHFLAFTFEGRLGEALKFSNRPGDVLKQKNEIIKHFILRSEVPWAGAKFDLRDSANLNWAMLVLAGFLRDIYLLKLGVYKEELINLDLVDEIFHISRQYTFTDLNQLLSQLCNMAQNLQQNINPNLVLDNLRMLWKK